MVPRLRTCTSPMEPASAASAGTAAPTSDEAATAAWRVIAPIRTPSPRRSIPASASIPLRSTRSAHEARRKRMVGIRLMPPASGRPSSDAARRALASSSEDGRW